MNKASFHLTGLLIIAALILSACNLPVSDTKAETSTPDATSTADLYATQPTQPKLLPSKTPTVTLTLTATLEPSATSTPEPPKAEVLRVSNCRVGPGGLYDLVVKYEVGQKLNVVAKDLGGGYWFVQNPEKVEEQCYL